ncbi:hypothetical protein ALMP_73730 [Streptomyces sp. A012304]|nr:hypothetical protein ALMP_73730 [Streptomyces sp. A012304]
MAAELLLLGNSSFAPLPLIEEPEAHRQAFELAHRIGRDGLSAGALEGSPTCTE